MYTGHEDIGDHMYTSEIRQTDHDRKPVAISPALLDRVRRTDQALRAHVGAKSNFQYTGLWVFPEPDKAMFSLQVKIPSEPEAYTFSLPPNTLSQDDPEAFASQAVDMILVQAQKSLQASLARRLRELLTSDVGDE
jgi:hypothetical protein